MRIRMRQITYILGIVLSLFALYGCSNKDDNKYLNDLDTALKDYPKYISLKQHSIQEKKDKLPFTRSKEAKYNLLMDIYRDYQSFALDSSLTYINQAIKLADELGDEERIMDTNMSLAFLYNFAGMHHEALEIYNNTNVAGHSSWLRRSHFYLGMNVYRNLATYSTDKSKKDEYTEQMDVCRDSAIAYAPEDLILKTERLNDNGKTNEAIAQLSKGLPDNLATNDAGLKYYVLSEFYGKLGETDKQIKYLAMSSTAGVKNAVREYVALRELAVLLYKKGDIDRSYRYIHQCIEDAEACNARMRIVETSTFLSVIDSTMVKHKHESRNMILIALTIVGILLILLSIASISLRKKMRIIQEANNKLKEMNEQIKEANIAQDNLNKQLSLSNKIKEEYITRFMQLCLLYIGKMEDYRKHLSKVAHKHNFDELYDTIQSNLYLNKELETFYNNFDEAFLRLFPNFINDVNALLRSDSQIELKEGKRLNTELRILALMRLGITDSSKVQKFLRCSSSTVYNYRTNMRNKAKKRDTFEEDVMKL